MSGNDAARQFASLAEDYFASVSHRQGRTLALLLEHAAPRPGESALDVGTGAGHTALALARLGARVVALDVTPGMLAKTRESARAAELTSLEVVRAAAEALPLRDASLDIVVSRTAAHHFDDPVAAIAEMRRVLRPGGRVVISDLAAALDPALRALQHAIEVLHDPTHRRTWTPPEWEAELARAGFEDVRIEGGTEAGLPELEQGTSVHEWCARSRTPPEDEAEIRRLLEAAPAEHRRALRVREADDGLRIDLHKLVASGRLAGAAAR